MAATSTWLGTKPPTAMFFPAKPQLFGFKRGPSSADSPNGTTVTNGGVSADLATTKSSVDADEAIAVEPISLQTVLETRVPSLFEGFKPSWWLPNGHLQTGYVVAGDFSKVDTIMYER
jgi:hypothetical protein